MDNIRLRLIIEGRVQGVWFRDSTRRKAKELGVQGWVKNRNDGGVEVLAEGSPVSVAQLAEWCRTGPPGAIVQSIKETNEKWRGEFNSFDIVF